MQYCHIIRYPYQETIENKGFRFNTKNLLDYENNTLKQIGLLNHSTIHVRNIGL